MNFFGIGLPEMAVIAAIGLLVFETVRRRFALIWGEIQTDMAAAQQAKEST